MLLDIMNYREPLPEGCPPSEADEIDSERSVYRLVPSDPPTAQAFRSRRAEEPSGVFDVSECLACGVSVYAEISDCAKTRKLPRFRSMLVCRVRLGAGAGRIQQTFKPSHHTWWPMAEYDILGNCEVQQ